MLIHRNRVRIWKRPGNMSTPPVQGRRPSVRRKRHHSTGTTVLQTIHAPTPLLAFDSKIPKENRLFQLFAQRSGLIGCTGVTTCALYAGGYIHGQDLCPIPATALFQSENRNMPVVTCPARAVMVLWSRVKKSFQEVSYTCVWVTGMSAFYCSDGLLACGTGAGSRRRGENSRFSDLVSG